MGGSPDIPSAPQPKMVQVADSGVWVREDANAIVYPTAYTSFDKGKTWVPDPNIHFHDQTGKQWWVPAGEDPHDKSKWHVDTMAGYHVDQSTYDVRRMQYEAAERAKAEAETARSQWNQMFAFQQEQAALAQAARKKQLDMLEQERKATMEAASAERRKKALFSSRALRFASGRRRGRAGTIKTGSLGLSAGMMAGEKAKLLGGNA